ncbi:MAG: abhydrolase domain-containing 18, partial [Edaphobacter sp.]
MYSWETALTTRDTNRIVRPLEWGFDWLEDFSPLAKGLVCPTPEPLDANPPPPAAPEDYERMIAINADIVARADKFFGYKIPTDFHLETRYPQLFPTNVRPETLAQDAELKRKAEAGELEKAEFLRFTSAVHTIYPENDIVNARWYPAPEHRSVNSIGANPHPTDTVISTGAADSFTVRGG